MAQRLCYFLSNKLSVTLLFDVLPTLLSVLAAHQLVALSCILYSEFLYPTMCVCVSVSCHLFPGMERDVPYDLERSSDRRFLVKKPYFPQCRNRSLDYPAGTGCMYPSFFPADMCGMTSSMKCMRVEIFAQCIFFLLLPILFL